MSKKKNEEISDEIIRRLIESNDVQKGALKKILKGIKQLKGDKR